MIQLARKPHSITNLPSPSNPVCKDIMTLEIGSRAPDFSLKTKTADGLKDVSLGDHLGNSSVVLLFFPFAFTSVCMAEACSVRDDLKAYEELNAKVFGISVDSPFAQEAMALKENLNFPLLSDFNKIVSKSYDVLYEDFIGFEGVAKRSAFVVSIEGNITFAWSSDDPQQLPDFNQIKQAL
jgi:peroxiredoxin